MATRNRPRPGSEIAKSISSSRWKYSICSGVIKPKAAARTASGDSTCLFTAWICPSILILIGALDVKNRSDALRSTMSLKSGLVFSPVEGELTLKSSVSFIGCDIGYSALPSSSSSMSESPPASSAGRLSRLLSSFTFRRSSFFESALRIASS